MVLTNASVVSLFFVFEFLVISFLRFFNVFTISKENGIGILDDPVPFSSKRPVHFDCEAPVEIHRGESVGIRCLVMNRYTKLRS